MLLKWVVQEDPVPASSKVDVGLNIWIVGPVNTREEALEWVSSGRSAVFTFRTSTDNRFGADSDTEFDLPADLAPGSYGVVQEVQTAANNYKSVTFMRVVK
jgi:hypothetical protein